MIGIVGRADIGTGNDFTSIVSENEIGKKVALVFGNANPCTRLFTAIGTESAFVVVDSWFPPTELCAQRDALFDA